MYLKLDKEIKIKAKQNFRKSEEGINYIKTSKKIRITNILLLLYSIALFATDKELTYFSIFIAIVSILLYLTTYIVEIKLINNYISKKAKKKN